MRLKNNKTALIRVGSVLGFILLWEAVTLLGIFSPVLLPSPIAVIVAAWNMLLEGVLLPNVLISLTRALAGFILAVAIAVPLGIVAGWYASLFHIVDPLVELFRPIPVLALLPVAILWFGIGETSKLFIIMYGTFFPVFLNTVAGVRLVDSKLTQAAASLGATPGQIFRKVVLMAAMPSIVTGLRLGLGFSFLTLVAAELLAAEQGLGYLLTSTQLNFRTDETLVATLMFGIIGFLTGAIIIKLENHFLRWKEGL